MIARVRSPVQPPPLPPRLHIRLHARRSHRHEPRPRPPSRHMRHVDVLSHNVNDLQQHQDMHTRYCELAPRVAFPLPTLVSQHSLVRLGGAGPLGPYTDWQHCAASRKGRERRVPRERKEPARRRRGEVACTSRLRTNTDRHRPSRRSFPCRLVCVPDDALRRSRSIRIAKLFVNAVYVRCSRAAQNHHVFWNATTYF